MEVRLPAFGPVLFLDHAERRLRQRGDLGKVPDRLPDLLLHGGGGGRLREIGPYREQGAGRLCFSGDRRAGGGETRQDVGDGLGVLGRRRQRNLQPPHSALPPSSSLRRSRKPRSCGTTALPIVAPSFSKSSRCSGVRL